MGAAAVAAGADLTANHPAPTKGASWAEEARRAARARLAEMGAPGRRDEYWRYTDPTALTSPGAPAGAPGEGASFGETQALRLVFQGGRLDEAASDDFGAEDGVQITSLAAALAADIHWGRDLYGALEAAGQNPVRRPLAALNTAVAEAGAAIHVVGKPSRPIHLIYRWAEGDAAIRHLVKVEAGAEATILESGAPGARALTGAEVDVADGGALHHVRLQEPGEALTATHIFARLGAEAAFRSFTLSIGGALTRNECVIAFTGDHGSGHVAGAAIGAGADHHDDTVFITHDAEHCESRQVFKKVLADEAKGVFQGKILVQPGAQKTDGYQISQALLLDERAEFNAKPELEIYADDVACSHGSTCGAADETALFYLRSRGVPLEAAQAMLVLAFVDEAVGEIEDEGLADAVRDVIGEWLERRAG